MMYLPPTTSKAPPSTHSSSSTRVSGPAEWASTTRSVFGFAAISANRKYFVHEVVHLFELAVEPSKPRHLPTQLELHLFREHEQATVVAELRIVCGSSSDL